MEIQRLVIAAKLGDNDAFGGLVRLYQRRLLSSVRAVVGDEGEAEDLVQEAFVRAWSSLDSLRTAEAFPGWLWAMARNLSISHCRARRKDRGWCREDMDLIPDPRTEREEVDLPPWDALAAHLTADQRQLAGLRFGAGLSLRQTGLVLGIPETRVKSRLFTLRRRLEKALGPGAPEGPPSFLEEKIMTKIETLRLGAHVFERLSLAAQTEMARAVLAGDPFPETVLGELGRVDRGAEFLQLYGLQLGLGEMVAFLNYVDRFTECRLVEHLEVVAPAEAETLKHNFFVFEDVVLFDPAAIRLLHQSADPDLLAIALGGTELRVREHLLSALDSPARDDLLARIGRADGDRKLVRAAQELLVHSIKDLEKSGRLVVLRPEEASGGLLVVTAPSGPSSSFYT